MDLPPKNVLLFSGHMIDAPDRKTPRFPPNKERIAAAAISQTLEDIGATRGDLSISGGACGGDFLFAEACIARDMAIEIYIPFDEADATFVMPRNESRAFEQSLRLDLDASPVVLQVSGVAADMIAITIGPVQ